MHLSLENWQYACIKLTSLLCE